MGALCDAQDFFREQKPLDRTVSNDQVEQLQTLLDEVTTLRQEALGEFTAHELKEDRGSDCFISMCHALSNMINAKLSRQRFDIMMRGIHDVTATQVAAARDCSELPPTATSPRAGDHPDR